MFHLSADGRVKIKDSKKNRICSKKAFGFQLIELFTHLVTKESEYSEYIENILKVLPKDIENNMGQYVENDCITKVSWLYSKFQIVLIGPKHDKVRLGILKLAK